MTGQRRIAGSERAARRLAARLGAYIHEGHEELTAELAPGRRWDFSGTGELIASRESGETMADVWADLLNQMEFGVIRAGD